MRRTIILLLLLAIFIGDVAAQTLTPTSCRLLRNDLRARTAKRLDNNQQPCALILVEVVGVKDLEFTEKVGDVKYAYNQYEVYVPANTTTLHYKNNNVSGKVKLAEDFGLEIEGQSTYRLDFKTGADLHSATFYVTPTNATLTFDGKSIELDDNGVACMERPVGKYSFTASAPGYEPMQGIVELRADEANEVTDVALNQIYHKVVVNSNNEASLFIDDKPYGKVAYLPADFSLPEGKHHYRLFLENYKDSEGDIEVSTDNTYLNADMKQMKTKVVKHSDERSRTTGTIRGYGTWEVSGLTFLNDMFKSYQIRMRTTWNTNFAGIFTWRYIDLGISGGIFKDRTIADFDTDRPDDYIPLNIEDAMQLGVMIPLSKYNHYLFTVLGGMYGGYWTYMNAGKDEDDNTTFEDGFFDYGIRISVAFLLHKFVIGAEYNKSITFNNASTFGVSIGMKF